MEYIFNKLVNPSKLADEIAASLPALPLSYVVADGSTARLVMDSEISAEDLQDLDALIAAHVPDDPDLALRKKCAESAELMQELAAASGVSPILLTQAELDALQAGLDALQMAITSGNIDI